MELSVNHFSELTTQELYEIYKLRVSVFVVEQNCPYQEIDNADKEAYHIWLSDETGILAYARILPKGTLFSEVSVGRVIAVKRRQGMGTKIVTQAVAVAKEKFSAEKITVAAQTYAMPMYEKIGFHPISGEFLEDGIPHVQMILDL